MKSKELVELYQNAQDETLIHPALRLRELVQQYDLATEMVKRMKQRIKVYHGDDKKALDALGYFKSFESGKEDIKRLVKWLLNANPDIFPIWHEWLKPNRFGINSALAGQFISRLEYKFIPILEACPHCKSKGCSRCKKTGEKKKWPAEFRIEPRTWNNPSSIHHFCALHNVYDERLGKFRAFRRSDLGENGIERKQGSGACVDMGPILYQAETQFVMQKSSPYRKVFDDKWEEIKRTRPEESCEWCKANSETRKKMGISHKEKLSHPQHQLQMAKRKVGKIFLTHWYVVSHTLRGLPVTKPYPIAVMGHTNYIKPLGFDKKITYIEDER